MGEVSEFHTTQSRRKHLLPWSWRIIYSSSIRLLWPTADTVLLHIYVRGHIRLVRCRDKLWFLLGCAHPERILLYRHSSGRDPSMLIMSTALPDP